MPIPMIDMALARGLVAAQFPQWAGLPLQQVIPGGSDHVIFRLGRDLAVRLPPLRGDGSGGEGSPVAATARPAPATGHPGARGCRGTGLGYPWRWAVSRWLDGEIATVEALGASREAAVTLAGFLRALQCYSPADLLSADARDDLAGQPLASRDRATRDAIARHGDVL